ncbi:hypothetical protein A3Q56_01678 [Intoshia linei]|uniref:Uncharacterized protein n=1 Tax=Intoshia linei TaxID=1819745 RepID=A0A177BAC2_9BILA|nr:hypothetical protein A3Q56_01678 [Intoshia linei]
MTQSEVEDFTKTLFSNNKLNVLRHKIDEFKNDSVILSDTLSGYLCTKAADILAVGHVLFDLSKSCQDMCENFDYLRKNKCSLNDLDNQTGEEFLRDSAMIGLTDLTLSIDQHIINGEYLRAYAIILIYEKIKDEYYQDMGIYNELQQLCYNKGTDTITSIIFDKEEYRCRSIKTLSELYIISCNMLDENFLEIKVKNLIGYCIYLMKKDDLVNIFLLLSNELKKLIALNEIENEENFGNTFNRLKKNLDYDMDNIQVNCIDKIATNKHFNRDVSIKCIHYADLKVELKKNTNVIEQALEKLFCNIMDLNELIKIYVQIKLNIEYKIVHLIDGIISFTLKRLEAICTQTFAKMTAKSLVILEDSYTSIANSDVKQETDIITTVEKDLLKSHDMYYANNEFIIKCFEKFYKYIDYCIECITESYQINFDMPQKLGNTFVENIVSKVSSWICSTKDNIEFKFRELMTCHSNDQNIIEDFSHTIKTIMNEINSNLNSHIFLSTPFNIYFKNDYQSGATPISISQSLSKYMKNVSRMLLKSNLFTNFPINKEVLHHLTCVYSTKNTQNLFDLLFIREICKNLKDTEEYNNLQKLVESYSEETFDVKEIHTLVCQYLLYTQGLYAAIPQQAEFYNNNDFDTIVPNIVSFDKYISKIPILK